MTNCVNSKTGNLNYWNEHCLKIGPNALRSSESYSYAEQTEKTTGIILYLSYLLLTHSNIAKIRIRRTIPPMHIEIIITPKNMSQNYKNGNNIAIYVKKLQISSRYCGYYGVRICFVEWAEACIQACLATICPWHLYSIQTLRLLRHCTCSFILLSVYFLLTPQIYKMIFLRWNRQ